MLLYMTSFRLSRTFSKVFDVFTGPSLYSATFYFITLSSVCQEVFQLFSFARLPLISDNFWIVTHCLAFVNSFLNFFKFLLAAPRISRAAWLECQTLSLDSFALCIVLPLFQMSRNRFFSLLLYHLYWFCSPKLSSSHSVL